jgi:GIY-YIG catalytic domain
MDNAPKQAAHQILNTLAFQPFANCLPLTRPFLNVPARPGLYAVRHKDAGLLYIGKSKSLRGRFSGGHKAFLWAWLDKYHDDDVRLAIYPLSPWENPALILEIVRNSA